VSVVIFTGPSLSAAEAAEHLDAIYLPPVSQGDVYRVGLKRPRAIGIIDGLFERVPAVWHKEILWAMSEGIHVFGAASMGALRAAELSAFGMVGVGRIFEAFHDGTYEDDDEVAVTHASAELGFRVISEAMVNIRVTLEAGVREQVIDRQTHDALVEIGKALFYPERTYAELLNRGRAQGLAAGQLERLSRWLPTGRRNQKRTDAIALLGAVDQFMGEDPGRKLVDFCFEETEWWLRAQSSAGELRLEVSPESDSKGDVVARDELLEELRLEPETCSQTSRAAMLRHLLVAETHRRGISLEAELLEEVSNSFRRERGLLSLESLEVWLRVNGLDQEMYGHLILEQAVIQVMSSSLTEVSEGMVANELRVSGDYERLRARASDKRSQLGALGLSNPGLVEAEIGEHALLRWHLGDQADLDWGRALHGSEFRDLEEFRRALLREYCYRRAQDSTPPPASSDRALGPSKRARTPGRASTASTPE